MNKNSFRLSAIASAVFTVTLLGCTAIQSTRHAGLNAGSGLAYYLPKGTLKVMVVQEITAAPTANTSDTNQTAGPLTTNCYVSADVVLTPDRNWMYVLKMKPSWLADDYMRLGVTNGLLQTVSLTNSDQSLGVFSNLVLTAIEAYKIASGAFVSASGSKYITNIFLVNPFDSTERGDLRDKLAKEFNVAVDFKDFPTNSSPSGPTNTPGIFYRPLQAYQLAWNSSQGAGAGSFYFPNVSPVLSLDVKRASFVSQSYNITFDQGFPLEVTLNKPSQALAASSLPLSLARSIVSLPTNLIQLRVNYDTANSALLNAQSTQASNMLGLLQSQQKLNNWILTNGAAVQSNRAPVPGTVGGNTN